MQVGVDAAEKGVPRSDTGELIQRAFLSTCTGTTIVL